jgi:resolvase-like protein
VLPFCYPTARHADRRARGCGLGPHRSRARADYRSRTAGAPARHFARIRPDLRTLASSRVETASRFARDLMVQEVGHARLRERGIDLIAVDNPGSFIDDTPTAKLVRQVLGAISEFDKAMTVAKLRGARDRKRRDAGKCEGRKSHAERNPSWWRWPSVYVGRGRKEASVRCGISQPSLRRAGISTSAGRHSLRPRLIRCSRHRQEAASN